MSNHERRSGPTGQAANELESVLTAVWSSADEIAEGQLAGGWRLQQELGELEAALTRALTLVRRLSTLARETPLTPLRREDFAVGSAAAAPRASGHARPTPVFAGVAGDLHLDTEEHRRGRRGRYEWHGSWWLTITRTCAGRCGGS